MLAIEGIRRSDFVVFVVIATLAGERQIVQAGRATLYARENVLDRESLSRIACLAAAVFTAATRAHADLLA